MVLDKVLEHLLEKRSVPDQYLHWSIILGPVAMNKVQSWTVLPRCKVPISGTWLIYLSALLILTLLNAASPAFNLFRRLHRKVLCSPPVTRHNSMALPFLHTAMVWDKSTRALAISWAGKTLKISCHPCSFFETAVNKQLFVDDWSFAGL